jgi:tetratricopeptide (TPR) repeat protein
LSLLTSQLPNPPAHLSESSEWAKLLRHFELGQGFAFIILLVPSRAAARLCRTELDSWLRAHGQPPPVDAPLNTPLDLANLPEHLLAMPQPAGVVWIDGSGTTQLYQQSWSRCAMKLNRTRDGIAARFTAPLILVGPPWVREILRDVAPDFWSVRAFVAEIPPAPLPPLPVLSPERSIQQETEFALDPDLALRAIADIRDKPGQERQLSQLLNRAGTELMRRGRSAEALPLLNEARELDEKAVQQEPSRADYLRDLSVSYNNLGDLQRALGHGEAARQFFEKSLNIRERLVQQEPSRAAYLRDLSVSYNKLGDLQSALGHGEAARQFFEKDLDIVERLVQQEPSRVDYLRDLSISYERLGDLQRTLGHGESARQFFEKSLDIAERLVQQEPSRTDYLRDLSVSYERLGDLHSALGHGEAARQFFEKSLDIAERLVQQEPSRADYLRDLMVSLFRLNTVQHLQRALDILLGLQKTNRLNPTDEKWIAEAERRIQRAKSAGT